MSKNLEERLKLRPPWKFKKRGLQFSPGAQKALESLNWSTKEFLEKFKPEEGPYEIMEDNCVIGRFYGRYNRSGIYMIHYRDRSQSG